LLVLFVVLSSLAACKVSLFSELDEREGNEILATLLEHDVPAAKVVGKDNVISITVDESDVARAIEILNRNGYPRDDFNNLGDIFQQQGLISSPLEERVRYIYGLSQTIAETLSLIDGVITARVHIVLPQAQPLDEIAKPSSASVFIKYRPGSQVQQQIQQIKLMVQNSVEGLSYDKISVALFPADEPALKEAGGPSTTSLLGIQFTRASLDAFAVLAALLLVALAGAGYLFWRLSRSAAAGGS